MINKIFFYKYFQSIKRITMYSALTLFLRIKKKIKKLKVAYDC